MTETNDAFICPLTHDVMRNPWMDPSGITYEKAAILKWLETSKTSPVTRLPLMANQLAPNRALKDLIQAAYPNLQPLASQNANEVQQVNGHVDMQVTSAELDGKRIVMVNLDPPTEPNQLGQLGRPPVDLVCVIDVSGSMGNQASLPGSSEQTGLTILDLVKHSTRTIIHTLGPTDRLGIVTFTDVAEVVCGLTNMTEEGKAEVQAKVEALGELSATNIYDGLVKGLQVLQNGASKSGSILLLTDGQPNVEPARGTLQGFRKFRDGFPKTDFCKSVSTFGFGYELDSALLLELAKTWSSAGAFSFIPDSGLVGTVFVNTLGNVLSRVPADVTVKVEGKSRLMNAVGYNVKPTLWGWDISGVSLQYGQSKQFVFEAFDSEPLKVTLELSSSGDAKYTSLEETKMVDPQEIAKISMAQMRNEACEVLGQVMWLNSWFKSDVPVPPQCRGLTGGATEENLAKSAEWVQQLAAKTQASPAFAHESTKDQASALLKDVQGQMTEAVSRMDWFHRWGRHYLPSLQRAHLLQECNNFKDAGVQVYGGQLFSDIREGCDQVFVALPPPVPRPRASGYGASNHFLAAAPVSMGRYYNPNNPCFDGRSPVSMADGSVKRVMDIQKGDLVKSVRGASLVKCVVKTWCDASVALLVELGQCRVTPWHPVKVNGEWKFPCEVAAPKWTTCEAVYSFVLDSQGDAVLEVGGHEAVALGHGMDDEARKVTALGLNGVPVWNGVTKVLGHDYFARGVLEDLKQLECFDGGLVEFGHGCLLRKHNIVVGFNFDRLISRDVE